MTIAEIRSSVEAIEKDSLLIEDKAIDKRIDAIDFLEFHILGQLNALLHTLQADEILLLKTKAEKVKNKLEEINNDCFSHIQELVRKGIKASDFKHLVYQYFPSKNNNGYESVGYDNLDIFINGIFPEQDFPEETKALEAEMIYYQKTPARIILKLVEKANFKQDDVFYDIGCGLGQVVIMVHLLSGTTAKGIDYEPAFCEYASNAAKALHLPDVQFIHADARNADYADGTVFFMFTPFVGNMLSEVLAVLEKEALSGKIKIFTYGPCSMQVATAPWLFTEDEDINDHKLCFFQSL